MRAYGLQLKIILPSIVCVCGHMTKWGNGIGAEVVCEISGSCPLRQKCALDFLFPHSHDQKTTRTAAIGIIMETTWRKANQTCQPKPLEHGCLPALDCSLGFVLSHIYGLLCYTILTCIITNAPSPITFPLMLGFYRNLISISSSKPCPASCILLYLRFMKPGSDIMSVPKPMPEHRQGSGVTSVTAWALGTWLLIKHCSACTGVGC